MNPIRNPFTRDAYPALTDAIKGVVNGQPRPVEEDLQTPERAAEMVARKKKAARHSADAMKRNPEGAGTAAIVNSEIDLHIKDKRERDSKKTYGKGGKVVREDIQTPARERQMKRKMKAAEHGSDAASSRYIQAWDAEAKSPDTNPKAAKALRAAGERFNAAVKKRNALYTTQRKEGSSKKTYGVGGKVVRESASPQGGDKKPFNPFNPTLGDLLRSKQQDKKAPKGKPVKEAVTAAQQKVFARERERMLNALNNPKQKLSPTEREAVLARGARNAAAETRKGAVSPTGEKSPIHSAAKAHHEYARRESKKLDAIAKRKVQEAAQNIHEVDAAIPNWLNSISLKEIDKELKRKADAAKRKADAAKHKPTTGKKPVKEAAQLDERIIDEVDFFQASKNLLTGKGFKTNREVSGARVNANMAAMQRRKARAAKTAKKTK
jgi:hypothetical protein